MDDKSRAELLGIVRRGEVVSATDALLCIVLNEPDNRWVEQVVLECLEAGKTEAVRQLAVTCVGHIVRLHGELVDSRLRRKLDEYAKDPTYAGLVEAARDDIEVYERRGPF
ncbi:hypothetical protein [Actinokineospora fastidiosa]|uniref:Uncharacterized protein n=1 Tax=Actinokineospora fastidiosa TaxID=1816 RepID=A0A918GPE0_9PSEU|nr:hypothetical protein [Actinokineospora fastidiosa]GGS52394.1 hypothetical protein GCM10010171_54340 [Actinokineospora fastidiosa]